jgi:hypothetical protein
LGTSRNVCGSRTSRRSSPAATTTVSHRSCLRRSHSSRTWPLSVMRPRPAPVGRRHGTRGVCRSSRRVCSTGDQTSTTRLGHPDEDRIGQRGVAVDEHVGDAPELHPAVGHLQGPMTGRVGHDVRPLPLEILGKTSREVVVGVAAGTLDHKLPPTTSTYSSAEAGPAPTPRGAPRPPRPASSPATVPPARRLGRGPATNDRVPTPPTVGS